PAIVLGYVQGLAETDPIAALDVAIAEKSSIKSDLIPAAIRGAARQGGNSARIALERISDPKQRRDAALEAIKVLINETLTDPFQFISDTIGLDHVEDVKNLMRSSSSELVEANPAAAANWAAQLPREQAADLLKFVINRWSDRDPKAAQAWMLEKQ